jgi:isopenicillin N synthase-like dioxygenase
MAPSRTSEPPADTKTAEETPIASSFTELPILDLSLARDPATKTKFLDDLRYALLEVGFLYISNTGIDDALIDEVITQGKAFFDLPEEAKLEVEMKNGEPARSIT